MLDSDIIADERDVGAKHRPGHGGQPQHVMLDQADDRQSGQSLGRLAIANRALTAFGVGCAIGEAVPLTNKIAPPQSSEQIPGQLGGPKWT